jgi:peptidoglycan/LPS O-acetylase OafA/YrhL
VTSSASTSAPRMSNPTPDRSSHPAKYFGRLDSLRFLAFLGVFLCHTVAIPQTINQDSYLGQRLHALAYNGARGVEMFFVISGFIIIYLLINEKAQTGTISLRDFYIRRTLRIWPLFYLIIAYVFLLKPALSQYFHIHYQYSFSAAYLAHHQNPWLWLTFLGNFDIFLGNGAPPNSELVLLWSLCVEEQFYLVTPALLKFLKPRQIPYALAGGIVAGIAFRGIFEHKFTDFSSNFDTFVLLDFFAAGGLLAYLVTTHEQGIRRFMASKISFAMELIFLLFVLYLCTYDTLDNRGFFEISLKYSFYAVLFCLLLLSFEFKGNTSGWFKGNRVLTYLGRISYGLYMFHMVVWTIVYHYLARTSSGWTMALLTLAITIAVSALSYQWFEAPFLALRRKFRR